MYEKEREELIERLVKWGYLTKSEVIEAFKKVPRHEFVPENLKKYSYADQPLPIGHGQTISAPSMIAIMLESLDLRRGQRVLEIGTGSGYNAALIAEIVGSDGEIFTMERIPELAEFGRSNLEKTGYGRVRVIIGDGTCGYEEGAPWDRILVTACAPEIPKPLIEQLKIGGRLGAPIGQHYMFQTWTVVEKREKKTIVHEYGGCSFVPLVGKYGWKEG
ncbi:MAG: protein-L-isoaspartate O-methyltransferase [Candidatus Hadarchaeum sp.]